jgi:hypothetical protein
VAFATFRAHVILSFAQMCLAPVGQDWKFKGLD